MPSITDIKQKITDSTNSDWRFFDAPENYVYTPDPQIRIEPFSEGKGHYESPWVEPYHHSDEVYAQLFRVYFNSSPVDHLRILRIDEGRFKIPSPHIEPSPLEIDNRQDIEEITLTPYEKSIGLAMSRVSSEHFESLLSRGRITVEQ